MAKRNGQLSATGYLLSQEALIAGLAEEEAVAVAPPAEFSYGAYKTFQVPVTQVEELTRLSFGELSRFDPLTTAPLESTQLIRRVDSHDDLLL
jgi:endonuclease G